MDCVCDAHDPRAEQDRDEIPFLVRPATQLEKERQSDDEEIGDEGQVHEELCPERSDLDEQMDGEDDEDGDGHRVEPVIR